MDLDRQSSSSPEELQSPLRKAVSGLIAAGSLALICALMPDIYENKKKEGKRDAEALKNNVKFIGESFPGLSDGKKE